MPAVRARIHRAVDDVETGRLPSPGHAVTGFGLFSPDGRWLASLGSQGRIHVWDVPARRLVLTNLPDAAWAFTPDSRQLLIGGTHEPISRYTLEPVTLDRSYAHATNLALTVDPQGRWFAGIRRTLPAAVDLVELASGALVRSITSRAELTSLEFSPDGHLLAAGGGDGSVTVWNASTGEQRAMFAAHQGLLRAMGFNRAGTLLATAGSDNFWRMWDAQTWQPLVVIPGSSDQVQFSSDDRMAASLMYGGRVRRLEIATSVSFRRILPPGAGGRGRHGLDISQDGRLVLASHAVGATLLDLATGRELATIAAALCSSALFTPDGSNILTASREGVGLWPLERNSGEHSDEFRIGAGQNIAGEIRRNAALSADGRWACAIRETSSRIAVFSPDNPDATIWLGQHPGASSVAISRDARWLATGTWKGRGVKVWNIPERRLEHEFTNMATATVEFSENGRWSATGSRSFQVWDTVTWREVYQVERPDPDTEWSWMTFSPDSRLLAVVLDNRDVRLVEAATGQVLANLEAPDRPRLMRLRFTPDSAKLVALQNDRGLQVWDLRILRAELAAMGLDWDAPPYPPESHPTSTNQRRVVIETK